MAVIEGLGRVALAARHVDDACALVAEAGWNQTADDWRLMIAAGDAIGFEDDRGLLVASAVALPYGRDFGWISMVLVTRAWRRRGIATYLLKACMESHEAAGRVPVLDATPEGETIYGNLGFKGQFTVTRWERAGADPVAVRVDGVRPIAAPDLDHVAAYDRDVFGGDRAAVVRDIATRQGAGGWVLADRDGYLMSRRGSRARQIGPLCADDDDGARTLLAAALRHFDEPLFIDVPDRHRAVIDLLVENGFSIQRPFRRMLRANTEGFGDVRRMYALAGPEYG